MRKIENLPLRFIFYPSNLTSDVYIKLVHFSTINNLLLKKIVIANTIFLSFIPVSSFFTEIFTKLKIFCENSIYLAPVAVTWSDLNKFYNLLTPHTFSSMVQEKKREIVDFIINFIKSTKTISVIYFNLKFHFWISQH